MKCINKYYWIKKNHIIIISVIILIGCFFRIIGCFYDYPIPRHPDEGVIVRPAIEMLKKHSWEADIYVSHRPDQFAMKSNAIIFTIVSWIKFKMPAYEAYKQHRPFFYITARIYTVLFGILLIPLSIIFINKIFRNSGIQTNFVNIACATILSFSIIFIQNSHFITPDIPLTFFILLFSYYSMLYLENNRLTYLVICSVITGIGISLKYPMAIMCIFIAFMIIYTQISNYINLKYKIKCDKNLLLISKKNNSIIDKIIQIFHNPNLEILIKIVKYGIFSVIIIIFTFFIIAPNLIINIEQIHRAFTAQSRPHHLGADGLGFYGNIIFYAKVAITDLGYISIIPFFVGIFYLLKYKSRLTWSLTTFIIFWICMSKIPLHWIRWGLPVLLFYNIVVAIGIGISINYIEKWDNLHLMLKICLIFILLSNALVLTNVFISGTCYTKQNLLVDSRVVAAKYCELNGITKKNSITSSYSPIRGQKHVKKRILTYENKDKTIKYFVMSDSHLQRYKNESKRYLKQIELYNAIDKKYKLIYKLKPDGNFWQQYTDFSNDYVKKNYAILNIFYGIKYIFTSVHTFGCTILIYDLTDAS